MCKTDDSTMDRFPWYFGELNRRQATDLLQRTENGTFLVRYSADHGHYAISLKYVDFFCQISIGFSYTQVSYHEIRVKYFFCLRILLLIWCSNYFHQLFWF